MKIGIVGLGLKNPYTYAPILNTLGAEIDAVYDSYSDLAVEYAKKFNCKYIANIEDFPSVDGVIIDSINSLHLDYARLFLNRSIPVFIDKPLSNSPDMALSFLEEEFTTPWFSCSPLRFSPVYLEMKDKVREPIQFCRVAIYHTMEHFVNDKQKQWHDKPFEGGGMLVDIGIHGIELLNMFMGEKKISSISYLTSSSTFKKSLSNDNHHVTIVYGDGSCSQMDLVLASSYLDYSVELLTKEKCFINSGFSNYKNGDYSSENAYGAFSETMGVFIEMIKTGKPPISKDETRINFELIKAIQKEECHVYS